MYNTFRMKVIALSRVLSLDLAWHMSIFVTVIEIAILHLMIPNGVPKIKSCQYYDE